MSRCSMVELAPGTILGGEYRIVRLLGTGGMGAVYVAEQASTSELRALKVMHPTMVLDARSRERFEQEARVGSRIASDHVVRVIAAGVDQTLGTPWLAMELLEGEDLANALRRRGGFAPDEVLTIFRQLCHALGAAHAVGIVHRDIKPENVFLAAARTTDARTNVKVLDFGIAKLVLEAQPTATTNVGTPLWMAPEQTDPRAPISGQADVWALGLMAFTLLTGRSYWRSAEHSGATLQSLFREVLVDPLAGASVRAGELGLQSRLPTGFDAWFSRCVARDPAARFASVAELYAALEPVLRGFASADGARAHSVPALSRAAAQPGKWMLAAVVAVVLLAGGVVAAAGVVFYLLRDDPIESTTSSDLQPPAASAVPEAPTSAVATASAAPASEPAGGVSTAAQKKAPSAPSAQAPTKSGKPFNEAVAMAQLHKAEAMAASACKSQKAADAGSESYKGTIGLYGNGSVRSFSMQGAGGARECVKTRMYGFKTDPFDEDPIKTEILAWSVNVP